MNKIVVSVCNIKLTAFKLNDYKINKGLHKKEMAVGLFRLNSGNAGPILIGVPSTLLLGCFLTDFKKD